MIGNFPLEIFELCFKRLECVHVSYWRQEGFYRKGARKRKALPPTHDLEILWMTSWCHAESGLLLWGGRHKSQSKSIILLRTVCVITFSLNPQFNRKPEYHDTNGEIGSFLKAHARSLPAIWMNKKRIYKLLHPFLCVSLCNGAPNSKTIVPYLSKKMLERFARLLTVVLEPTNCDNCNFWGSRTTAVSLCNF